MFSKQSLFFNELTYQYENKFSTDYKLIIFIRKLATMTFPNSTMYNDIFRLNDERFSVHETVLIEKIVHHNLMFFQNQRLHLPARSPYASIIMQLIDKEEESLTSSYRKLTGLVHPEAMQKLINSILAQGESPLTLYVSNLHQSMNYNFDRDFRLELLDQQEITFIFNALSWQQQTVGMRGFFRPAIDLGVTRFNVFVQANQEASHVVLEGTCLDGEVLCSIILIEDVSGFLNK